MRAWTMRVTKMEMEENSGDDTREDQETIQAGEV